MILVIDFDNTRQDILLADVGSVRRFSSPPGKGFRALEDVLEVMRGQGYERAKGIAVVLPGEGLALHPSEAASFANDDGEASGAGENERGGEGLALHPSEASGAGEKGKRNMSWSTVRAAVALTNALAFAWGVPAVAVRAGEESSAPSAPSVPPAPVNDISFASLAEKAIAGAESDAKVSATYDGEPNITKAKSEGRGV